jgi:hypothetical protein
MRVVIHFGIKIIDLEQEYIVEPFGAAVQKGAILPDHIGLLGFG